MTTTPHQSPPPRGRSRPDADAGSVLSTLNEDGSRRWLKPRPSPGRWLNRRRALGWFLIALFTALPHIRVGGKPVVLLDLTTRHFTILGHTFLPTDTLLLALLLLGTFISIFLFTALLGRVWCGWACPQTVYLELVFRPIERFFDGTPGRRKSNVVQKSALAKPLKFITFFLVACFLSHTFLAYFVPTEQLRVWMTRSPFDHLSSFLVMAVVTGLMLFDFGFFREQTCLVACPYGRMQSTLLDRNSLIVSYDPRRGEPRGKGKTVSLPVAGAPSTQGDCVDCGLCVATCPAGIDIRNGLQMECVHCTQCIDACDAVMSKLGRATGLIRYASQNEIDGSRRRFLRPRTIIYTILTSLLVIAFTMALLAAPIANVQVLRVRGAVYTEIQPGVIANQVQVKIINRLGRRAEFSITLDGHPDARAIPETNPVALEPSAMQSVPVMLTAPATAFARGKLPVVITVTGPEGKPISRKYVLAGPGNAVRPGSTPAPAPKETP
ncbi:MAG: cytochrome c oxidase accessory protein CcoG [Phycisphaerales bacterium]|nr:cytochrome c oxidase accessory protein CcoG [Phycisphaerales bacterium]